MHLQKWTLKIIQKNFSNSSLVEGRVHELELMRKKTLVDFLKFRIIYILCKILKWVTLSSKKKLHFQNIYPHSKI